MLKVDIYFPFKLTEVFYMNNSIIEPTFTRLYTMFTNRKKHNFITSLLKLFEDEKQVKILCTGSTHMKAYEPPFLRYIAELIASLPFSGEEEPISIVNILNR